MTQDTNNQEWENRLLFLARSVEVWKQRASQQEKIAFRAVGFKEDEDVWRYEIGELKAFIRKVSQQSREDALKECVEEVIEALKTKECKDISCSEHYHRLKDSLKSKLC